MKTLNEMIQELPPELKDEVRKFVESLQQKKNCEKPRKFRLSWAGGLREFSEKYTSLELQKKALEWRGD